MLLQHYHNVFKKLVVILTITISSFLQAQIVNIENLRKEKDTIGWSGNVAVEFNIEKNRNRIIAFSNQLRIQYKTKRSTWFLINDMDFKEVNATDIVNNSTQHLRFSYRISPKFSYEAFMQSQTDEISEIALRALGGTGLRYNLYTSETVNFFMGATLMFEYENSKEEVENIIHRDLRNSIYMSFKIHLKNSMSIVSTNYYQPRMDLFSDFRILSETSIVFTILKNLNFTTSFSYLFDSFPATNAVKEQFKLSNGLVYFFD